MNQKTPLTKHEITILLGLLASVIDDLGQDRYTDLLQRIRAKLAAVPGN